MPVHGRKFRQERIERAQKRDLEAAERKPSQQLALLDKRLGHGQGAARERERLQRLVREGLDFPPARRIELAKNKAKKAKEEACQEESNSQNPPKDPQSEDKSKSNQKTSTTTSSKR